MKKVLHIISVIGLLLTLQSCDRISGLWLRGDKTQQEQTVDNQGQGASDKDKQHSDTTKIKTAKDMKSKHQQCENGIRLMRDSLNTLNTQVADLQSDIAKLKQRQEELVSDKVGVKNLFVYLAIFTIVAIVLVVLLAKKTADKSRLTEKQVKNIIAGFAKRHPEIINGNVQAVLGQHSGLLQANRQNISALNTRLGSVEMVLNELRNRTNSGNTQGKKDERPRVASRVFYMRRPLKDMEFDLSLKSETPSEDTLYRFETDSKNPNVAQFEFYCNTPGRVRWAWSTKDKSLERVCHATGNGTNGTYKCTAHGEAELKDGKWVVTRKAVVIFD